jgi:hypothetical protein
MVLDRRGMEEIGRNQEIRQTEWFPPSITR